jgi:NAD(P)-dependent dehydrogenase (short-subunit alcohol dehydrogenase family)
MASARVFAEAGASVVLAARDESALKVLAEEIEDSGGRAKAIATDVDEAASVERLVELTLDAFGRLDAAFNNAGSTHMPAPLGELAVEDFDRVLGVNVRGTFLSMKYEIAAMLKSGGGAIVNMSSTAGVQGVRRMSGYATAKHGVVGLTRSAALDYAEQNIRVNALAPGPTLNDRLAALPEEGRARVAAAVPMRRLGTPEEIGAAAVWLCSDQSAFITGVTVPVDGGRLAGSG